MVRNDDLLKGLAIGVGAAVLVPVVISALLPIVKPLARSALKMGVHAYERGREALEELGETVEDVVAEVEEEMLDAHEAEEAVADAAEVAGDSTPGAMGS
ncbi:MAG: DUF5132 domain-containing protein [Pseudomonadota bacterium]